MMAPLLPTQHNAIHCPLLFSASVTSDSVTHGLQHARLPIFTVSQSLLKFMPTELVMPFKHFIHCRPFFLQPSIFPSIGSFPISRLFPSGGQCTGASASASVLPMNIQGCFHLGLTGLISLLSRGLSRVLSKPQCEGITSLALSLFYCPLAPL